MRAVICRSLGAIEDMTIEAMDRLPVGENDVAIDVRACGVNHYDGLAVAGQYQTRPDLPFSPGGEVAGIVEAVGSTVDTLALGQRVIAFTGFGGYATKVVVSANRVFPIADGMDFETAAGFLIAYATSYHGLKDRAALAAGQTLLVLGAAGGVGLAAVELCKVMGARVIAAASSRDKCDLCRRHGADETIDYASDDMRAAVKAMTDGRGVDVVYDPVGGPQAEAALRCLAVGGRHLVIGFASGAIPQVAFNRLLLKQISVTGVLWGDFARAQPQRNARNLVDLMRWYEAGRLRPHVSETFALEDYAEALGRVMTKAAMGKIVLRIADGAGMPAGTTGAGH